ncbi:MAG: glycoside hydrolase family 27 protein [Bacteroidales bacterium]|nr:glycoside hydrolase family 27 protein [Bacteroidales bacterium]
MKKFNLSLVLIFMLALADAQKFEGLALTPPMGWNSWNHFGCDVNERMIREMADAMVESGMKDAGYVYVNIDDCWHGERDSLGFIHPDPERFPSGMKALADYIHEKGLKLGIYSDAGWTTCAGRPGSRGHEYQDAVQYAKWGIDYLKYDWCATEALNAEGAYLTMRDALFAAGRPVVFSLCEWGNSNPWEWGGRIGHLWRTTGDIYNCFDCVKDHGSWSSWGVLQILDMRDNDLLRRYAGPGHWNDPDMMEVGNGMSVSEDRAHFSLWCMLSAPLIAGNDLRSMGAETRAILTNREAIAVNQDSLGIQGYKHAAVDSLEVWVKPLSGNRFAVCFLNRGRNATKMAFTWRDHCFRDEHSGREADFSQATYTWFNVWDTSDTGSTRKPLKTIVPGHDVLMLVLSEKR